MKKIPDSSPVLRCHKLLVCNAFGLGTMQMVKITLLSLFKDILCLSKKGKQHDTGLVLQKGAVCGVAVKRNWVQDCLLTQTYFVRSFGLTVPAV